MTSEPDDSQPAGRPPFRGAAEAGARRLERETLRRAADRGSRNSAQAWRRVVATGVDYAMIAPWLVVLGLIGACLRRVGVFTELPQTWNGRLLAQLLVTLALTVPVTLALAWSQSSRRSTPGRRLLGLRVEGAGGDDDFSYHRSVIQSAVKVALPWELAHAGLWQLWGRDVSVPGSVLIGLAYVVAGAQLVLLCRGGG